MKKITASLWKRFEQVVFLVIKSILENVTLEEIEEKLTEPTHDGGYDGSFLIPCFAGTKYSQSKGYYKILFEAKLRKNLDKDLPLQDFSKSLIIAINMDSDALIVATNLRLSEGTKSHLRDFSDKTGLKTYYLSPYYIDNWMQEHISVKDLFVDMKIRELLKNSSEYSDLATPLVAFKNNSHSQMIKLPSLIGTKRKQLSGNMLNALQQKNGFVIIKGDSGVGKSFFCNYLIKELENHSYFVYSIDLKDYQTPRVLFLKLLEILWHMPFELLMALEKSSLKATIDEIDTRIVDADIKDAILSAFSRDLEHYSQSADIFNHYLIKYLLIIHNIRSRHTNIILYFSNINNLSTQMVDFVLQFFNSYTKQGKAILELRTSVYIDGKMKADDWNEYVKQFTTMEQILYQDVIEEFTDLEAHEYIRMKLNIPEPDIVLMDAIINVTGYNPLFIDSLVEYLNISGELLIFPKEVVLQRLNHLIVDDKRQLISMLIDTFCQINFFYAEFFEVIRIFQIPLKESYIKDLLCSYKITYIDQLVDANLIYRISENLEVVHPLQFECILNSHSLMDSSKRILAQKILTTLDETTLATDVFAMIKIRCYQILHDNQTIIDIEYPFAVGLMESGQYSLCHKYILDAYGRIEKMDPEYQNIIHLKILLLMVEICIYREEETVSEIDDYMEKLNNAVKQFSPKGTEDLEYIIFKANYYMTKNRYEHFVGDFEAAFLTLTEALEYTENTEKLGLQVIGNIQLEYAIALKEKEDLNKSLDYLKKCLKKQPDNPELLFTFHTQMYELYLITNPQLALDYIEKNRALCSRLSVATTLHNEVHWLNAQFYIKNYDICFTKTNSKFQEAEQIGLKNEAGRLANLLGNIYFQKKDFISAKKYYAYGLKVFEQKGYVSNVWSILINMSTLLVEFGDENAISYIRSGIDILSQSYRERIQKPYPLPGYYEKLQVAVVIIYYNIRKLELILPSECILELLDYFSEKLLNEKMKTWLLSLSCEDIINIMKETRHYHAPYLILGN